MDFLTALSSTYLDAPCEVLPNPLWKTILQIPQHDCAFSADQETVTELCLWNPDQLLLYWKPRNKDLDYARFGSPNLALVHQSALAHFPSEAYPNRTAYFRYLHPMDQPPAPISISHVALVQAEPVQQAPLIANFINRCYPNLKLDAKSVLDWTRHPTYQPDLWLWAIDQTTALPAALGIAEFDPQTREGALEWIQVLPEFRCQGSGRLVVNGLLKRLQRIAAFTTVSGQVDNPTNPGRLYRKCGFEGSSIWWVMRKNP